MCFKTSENKTVCKQLTIMCIGNLFFCISKVQGFRVVHLSSRSEKYTEEELLLTFSSTKVNVILVLLAYS